MDEQHVISFFDVTVLYLRGEPLPALPELPGRVHRAPPPDAVDVRLASYERAAAFAAAVAPGWRGWRP